LKPNINFSLLVREKIGAFAAPEIIQLAPALPKTRSGKIMRRILRKVAAGDSDFGDISTLADESVIQILLEHKPKSLK
jgi:acetyl-CoA synthetase